MRSDNLSQILKIGRISRWHRLLLHAVLVLALFIIVAPQNPVGPFPRFLFYKSISLLIILVPVYLNYFVLFPIIFSQNKWIYAGTLIILIALFAIISYLRFKSIDPVYVPGYIRLDYPLTSLLFVIISLTMIIGTTMLIKIIELFQREKEIRYELKQNQLESELQFLKLQISPHFYFNIMNSIYHSIKINPGQAERIVMELSEMMKYHIYDCSKEKVALDKELKAIRNYIGLQEMRLASKPVIDISVKGDIDNKFVSPFILIAFVENAFKQIVLERQSSKPTLSITMQVLGDEMQFSVSNTKTLFNSNKGSDDDGLIVVKKRLELLYPSRHQLQVDGLDNQYHVDLKIQLN